MTVIMSTEIPGAVEKMVEKDSVLTAVVENQLANESTVIPEEYREKWGLAPDYPMVAPSYAEARSKLARDMGLGRKKGAKGR